MCDTVSKEREGKVKFNWLSNHYSSQYSWETFITEYQIPIEISTCNLKVHGKKDGHYIRIGTFAEYKVGYFNARKQYNKKVEILVIGKLQMEYSNIVAPLIDKMLQILYQIELECIMKE